MIKKRMRAPEPTARRSLLLAKCSVLTFFCRRCCFCFFLFRRSFALSRVCHCHCHTLAHNTHISTIILFHPFSLHKRLQHFASLFHVHFFLLLFLPFALWFKYSFTFANHFYKYRLFAQLCLVFICSIILRFVVVCLLVCSFERFFCWIIYCIVFKLSAATTTPTLKTIPLCSFWYCSFLLFHQCCYYLACAFAHRCFISFFFFLCALNGLALTDVITGEKIG